jgi:hypothetical protein
MAPRFFRHAGAGIVLNGAAVAATLAHVRACCLAAQVLATGVVPAAAHVANRRWTP